MTSKDSRNTSTAPVPILGTSPSYATTYSTPEQYMIRSSPTTSYTKAYTTPEKYITTSTVTIANDIYAVPSHSATAYTTTEPISVTPPTSYTTYITPADTDNFNPYNNSFDNHSNNNNDNNAVLLLAVKTGDIQAVVHALDSGANPNCTTTNKQTPLHIAALNNYSDIVKILCHRGASLDVDSLGNSPFIYACQKADNNSITTLLQAKSSVNDSTDEGTALYYVVCRGDMSMLQTLLDYDVDVFHEQNQGRMTHITDTHRRTLAFISKLAQWQLQKAGREITDSIAERDFNDFLNSLKKKSISPSAYKPFVDYYKQAVGSDVAILWFSLRIPDEYMRLELELNNQLEKAARGDWSRVVSLVDNNVQNSKYLSLFAQVKLNENPHKLLAVLTSMQTPDNGYAPSPFNPLAAIVYAAVYNALATSNQSLGPNAKPPGVLAAGFAFGFLASPESSREKLQGGFYDVAVKILDTHLPALVASLNNHITSSRIEEDLSKLFALEVSTSAPSFTPTPVADVKPVTAIPVQHTVSISTPKKPVTHTQQLGDAAAQMLEDLVIVGDDDDIEWEEVQ